jgi:hypothetical protein
VGPFVPWILWESWFGNLLADNYYTTIEIKEGEGDPLFLV